MTLRLVLPIALAVALATLGCAGEPSTLVDLRIIGGVIGPRNDTVVQIESSGLVTRTHAADAPVTTQLDPSALAELNRQIHDAQFPLLAPSYGCGGCADQQVYEIAVSVDGRRYQTSVDIGVGVTFPDGLQHLVTTLQQIATMPPPR